MKALSTCPGAWHALHAHTLRIPLTFIFLFSASALAQWNLQAPLPTANALGGATFASPAHMFVCGQERLLLESTDAGRTWITRMHSGWGSDTYYAIHFADSLHGTVIGNGLGTWGTSDGGATWFQMTSVPGGSMYHLDFITPTVGFIGGNGSLAFTSDGGIHWITKSAYPSCPVIFGMDFRDTQVGLVGGIMAVTSEDGIFKTTNAGTSWIRKYPSSANDVVWMSNSEVIATVSTSIYRSTDVGDLLGRETATLVDQAHQPGSYTVTFDAHGLASGVYFYRLDAGGLVEIKTLPLLR